MAKKHLGLKPYKLQKVQLLTDENKRVRLQRCRQLKRRAAGQRWERILFTDEKLFTVEQSHNHQNDRIWSQKAPDQGVKINQEVYRRDILDVMAIPWAQQHFGDADWTFQQDSAPAHKAKMMQDWCKTLFPDFISSVEWPPYSPDLNPMDYSGHFETG
ncbi:hypothetical protein ACLKA7_000988 [Drosophila subpalustris]